MTTTTPPRRSSFWKAPTGRYVERGQVVRIKGETGSWKFLAYVEACQPPVEVVSTGSVKNVRAFAPDRVHGVSKKSVR